MPVRYIWPYPLPRRIQLTDIGVSASDVTWRRVRMSSDAHVTVRYTQSDPYQPGTPPNGDERHYDGFLKPASTDQRLRRSSRDDTLNTSVDSPDYERKVSPVCPSVHVCLSLTSASFMSYGVSLYAKVLII